MGKSALIHSNEPVVVILAAGGSSRLGYAKQLVTYDRETLLQRQVRQATGLGLPVVVVIGAYAEQIQAQNLAGAELLFNPLWEEGLSSSLHCAVTHIQAPAWLFMTVDQYRIETDHLQVLHGCWQKQPQCAVASAYLGEIGVPALIPARFREALMGLTGDRGAGPLLRRLAEQAAHQLVCIEFPDAAVDLDTESDRVVFQQYLERINEGDACTD